MYLYSKRYTIILTVQFYFSCYRHPTFNRKLYITILCLSTQWGVYYQTMKTVSATSLNIYIDLRFSIYTCVSTVQFHFFESLYYSLLKIMLYLRIGIFILLIIHLKAIGLFPSIINSCAP